ncbi:hypothetical protein AMJ86_00760 [bacterium SM23_57]|nr:MAG: hypothetical protein AMJ86_00760 [bacterium SM23_57]
MNEEVLNYRILKKAMSQLGVREMAGPEDNSPEILSYFSVLPFDWVKTDETAWCSAFINWVAIELGLENSGQLNARSWLTIGRFIEIADAEPGQIVVTWRDDPNSWKGHVGIFSRYRGNNVLLLGGNQDNSVCFKDYPKERILAVRQLRKLQT